MENNPTHTVIYTGNKLQHLVQVVYKEYMYLEAVWMITNVQLRDEIQCHFDDLVQSNWDHE